MAIAVKNEYPGNSLSRLYRYIYRRGRGVQFEMAGGVWYIMDHCRAETVCAGYITLGNK